MASGGIRIIEYETATWAELAQMGNLADTVQEKMGVVYDVGILRCTTRANMKLTLIGNAEATHQLIASGNAGNREGVERLKKDFPVMLKGWPHRLDNE